MQFFPSKVSIWLNSCQETCASAREFAGADNLQSSSAHVNYFRNDIYAHQEKDSKMAPSYSSSDT